MAKNTEVECGKVNKEKVTLDNGKVVNHKVLESTYQFWETDMKGNLRILLNKVWGQRDFIMERLTWVNIVEIDQMVKENTFGRMEIIIKATL